MLKKWGLCCVAMVAVSFPAAAQSVPESVDAGRIDPFEGRRVVPPSVSPAAPQADAPLFSDLPIPEDAKTMSVLLKKVHISGMTVFKPEEMKDIYAAQLGERIPLENLWHMAAEITRRYREKGYFLSRAYVPSQEIEGGEVQLQVVEGYIGEVVFHEGVPDKAVLKTLARKITEQRPVNARMLERQLLLLNDLPGMRFRSVLEPLENGTDGAVRLVIVPETEASTTSLGFDNYNSRYLGPHQVSVFHQQAFAPLQQTTLAALNSAPPQRLSYISLRHEVPVYPAVTVGVQGSFVRSRPGYILEANEVESMSSELAMDVRYALVRQRDETITLTGGVRGKDTTTDILDLPVTRDRIRAVWLGADYNGYDASNAYHYASISLTQGIGGLGASKAGSPVLSRAEAEPEFTKLEFYYQQQRYLGASFLGIGQVTGQYASDPLFSAEEFGVGGQRFGRGYEPSELTGDHGVALSVEVRYLGVPSWQRIELAPFVFYDIGAVWNEDTGQGGRVSAASAGTGVYATLPSGVRGTFLVARPLTYEASTPLYGAEGKDVRFLFSLSVGL